MTTYAVLQFAYYFGNSTSNPRLLLHDDDDCVCACVHAHRDGSYQTNMVNEMLATIVSIRPKDSGASGSETRESVVHRFADDMLSKLPADYVQHEV